MRPRLNRRHMIWGALLLGTSAVVWFHAWPAARLTALRTVMLRLDIPPGADRYDAKLCYVFKEAYAPDVRLRCLMTGGMLEIAVFVRGDEVHVLQTFPGSSVWDHEYREMILDGEITRTSAAGVPVSKWSMVEEYEKVPASLDDYPIRRHTRRLPGALLADLSTVWIDALEHAERNKPPRIGLDGGTSTYFARTADGRALAGSIWSPSDGPPAALDGVAVALVATAQSESGVPHLQAALTTYREAALKRTATSQELDHNESVFARRPRR